MEPDPIFDLFVQQNTAASLFDTILGFLSQRTTDFRQQADRLREASSIPQPPNFPGRGLLQDAASGLDPTGGGIVPEREGANLGVMIAAGLLGPDAGDVARSGRLIRELGERLPFMGFDEITDFTRKNFRDFASAVSEAPSQLLNDIDEVLVDGIMNTSKSEEVNAALELLASRTGAERAARAGLGDEVAQVGFRRTIEPESFSDDPFITIMDTLEEDTFLDTDLISNFLNRSRADEELFKFLLRIK